MKTSIIAALALLATGLAIAAPAGNANGDPCVSQVISLGDLVYLEVIEVAGQKYLVNFALYAESNGEAGLQRGGSSLLASPPSCQESANPDTDVI